MYASNVTLTFYQNHFSTRKRKKKKIFVKKHFSTRKKKKRVETEENPLYFKEKDIFILHQVFSYLLRFYIITYRNGHILLIIKEVIMIWQQLKV